MLPSEPEAKLRDDGSLHPLDSPQANMGYQVSELLPFCGWSVLTKIKRLVATQATSTDFHLNEGAVLALRYAVRAGGCTTRFRD